MQACPPTAGYRFKKFVRRNKRTVVPAALLAGTTIVAVVLLSISYLRLKGQQARTAAEYHRAEEQTIVANQQCLEAQDRLKLVFDALDQVFIHEAWAEAALDRRAVDRQVPTDPQREKADREFLERGLSFYERVGKTAGTTRASRVEIARALRRVGYIQHLLAHQKEAQLSLRRSIEIIEALSIESADPGKYAMDELEALHWLHWTFADGGQDREAEDVLRQVMSLVQKLSPGLQQQQVIREHVAYAHRDIARLHDRAGRNSEAIGELSIDRKSVV